MNDLQQQASDPDYSVWVSASAGTGKTKILTDRVLRLLISGVELKKILCLAFTNNAALEMQSRINNKLAWFANSDIGQLENALSLLLARKPSESELQYTKTLYPKLLTTQDKLNIHTIHSFCQKILKSFPFEAGINPEFQILDDMKMREIVVKIRNQLYLDPSYNSLTSFFLTNFHEVTINDIFDEIIEQKIKFKKLFAKGDYSELALLDESSKLNRTSYPRSDVIPAEAGIQEYTSHEGLEVCWIPAYAGMTSNKVSTNHATMPRGYDICDATTSTLSLYNTTKLLLAQYGIALNSDQEVQEFFLIKDGSKRKNIIPKELKQQHPKLLEELEYIQEQIFESNQLRPFKSNIFKIFINTR